MRSWGWLLLVAACGEVQTTIDAPADNAVTLTVNVSGSGMVASTPAGIACPGACSATFAPGTAVKLAAASAAPTSFTGWSDGCTPSRQDCMLTLAADTTVAAGFATQGTKRWLMTAGAAGSSADVRCIASSNGGLVIVGQGNAAMNVGGMPVTAGMIVARLDPTTGRALFARTIPRAVPLEAASDAAGNIVVVGFFDGTIDFGGGAITSNANSPDIFVAKYAGGDGAHVWSKAIGGNSFDFGTALALDAAGDVYVGGSFSQTANFGAGNVTSTGGATDDIFVARYGAATGAFVWAKTFGNADNEQLYGLAVDRGGAVVLAGTFTGSLNVGGTFLNSGTGGSDGLLAKLDGGNGSVLFAKDLGGAASDSAQRVAVDKAGNIIVQGSYTVPADVGGSPLPAGTMFVAKYTAAGSHIWSRGFTSNTGRIAVDSFDDIVVTGAFSNNLDLGGGTVLASAGVADAFVAKLGAPGGGTLWGKRFGGAMGDSAEGLALDVVDRVYASGLFKGFSEFDGQTVTSAGTSDLFVISLEP